MRSFLEQERILRRRRKGKEDVKYKQSLTVTYNSNDYEESTWTPRILIEEERGIGIELREMSKD